MSKNKVKNISKVTNSLKNVRNTAWRDVNFWQTNYNHFEDTAYYPISKEKTSHLEAISKFVIEKIGEKWGWVSAIIAAIIGALVSLKNSLTLLLHYKPTISASPNTGALNVDAHLSSLLWDASFWFTLVGFCLFWLWLWVISSLVYKRDSQCPKCKRHYALVETWKPREKETETSRGYVVTQVRYYKCKHCSYTDEVTRTFTQPKNS